jgi:FtsH-binding integral membrane protein
VAVAVAYSKGKAQAALAALELFLSVINLF